MHFRKPFIIRDFPAHKKWFFLHAAWWSIDQDFRSFNLVLSLVCRLGQGAVHKLRSQDEVGKWFKNDRFLSTFIP